MEWSTSTPFTSLRSSCARQERQNMRRGKNENTRRLTEAGLACKHGNATTAPPPLNHKEEAERTERYARTQRGTARPMGAETRQRVHTDATRTR